MDMERKHGLKMLSKRHNRKIFTVFLGEWREEVVKDESHVSDLGDRVSAKPSTNAGNIEWTTCLDKKKNELSLAHIVY